MANLEISAEIRWFMEKPVQEEVESLISWIKNNPRWTKVEAKDEKRDDLYLLASNNTSISPKLRGGKLEVKYLADPDETTKIVGPKNAPIGIGQMWHKWKWRYVRQEEEKQCPKKQRPKKQFLKKYDDLVVSGFLDETRIELRFNVWKHRVQRKFKDNNGELESFPVGNTDLPYGFLGEVTKLEVAGTHWCTIAVEVFGTPDQPMMTLLQQGVNSFLGDYEGPELKVSDSYSYPEWLNKNFS